MVNPWISQRILNVNLTRGVARWCADELYYIHVFRCKKKRQVILPEVLSQSISQRDYSSRTQDPKGGINRHLHITSSTVFSVIIMPV